MTSISNNMSAASDASSDGSDDLYLIAGTYTRPLGHVKGKAKGIHLLRHRTRYGTESSLSLCAANVPGLGDGPSFLSVLRATYNSDGGDEGSPQLLVSVVACNEGEDFLSLGTLSFATIRFREEGDKQQSQWTADVMDHGVSVIGTDAAAPCHCAVFPPVQRVTSSIKGQPTRLDAPHWIAAATYFGGTLSLHGVNVTGPDAVVVSKEPSAVVRHKDFSLVVPSRQEKAHAHQVLWLDENTVILCDLGADTVYTYHVQSTASGNAELTLKDVLRTAPGSGPRHCAISPVHPSTLFVLGELNNTVYAYRKTDTRAAGESVWSRVASFCCEPSANGGAAAIHCSFDGLIFVSIRDVVAAGAAAQGATDGDDGCHEPIETTQDRLVVLSFDPLASLLSCVGLLHLGGVNQADEEGGTPSPHHGRRRSDSTRRRLACPRDFCLHPTKRFVYIAAQNDNLVSAVPYRIVEQKATAGDVSSLAVIFEPTTVRSSVDCPTPVCVIPLLCNVA